MHIPSFQSLVCLSLLTIPYVSALPLDEQLQPRAAATCNASNVNKVKSSNKQPVTYCKSWLASKHTKSTINGLDVAQVSSACKCIQASASSATAKKTTSTKKSTSSARVSTAQNVLKKTTSTQKITSTSKTSSSTSTKKTSTSTSTKKTSSSTSTKKTSTSTNKPTAQTLVANKATSTKPPTTTSKKTTTSSSKTTAKSSSTSIKSSSTSSKISSSSKSLASSSSVSSSTFSNSYASSTSSSASTLLASSSSSAISSSSTSPDLSLPLPSIGLSPSSSDSSILTSSSLTSSIMSSSTSMVSSISSSMSPSASSSFPLSTSTSTSTSSSLWMSSSSVSSTPSSSILPSSSTFISSTSSIPSSSIISSSSRFVSSTSSISLSSSSKSTSIVHSTSASNSSKVSTSKTTSTSTSASSGKANVKSSTSSSSIQSSSSKATSRKTTSSIASSTTSSASSTSDVVANGDFSGGSFAGWSTGDSADTTFSTTSMDNDGNYEAVITYALPAEDNGSGQIYQNINVPAGYDYELDLDVYLNYPDGLPANVSCVISYSLGGDSMVLNQYGVAASSGNGFSDSVTGTTTSSFSGALEFNTFCNSYGDSDSSFTIAFGDIQFLISKHTAASSTSTSAQSTSASSTCASSVPTNTNLVTNGDFGTGSLSGWTTGVTAAASIGSASYAVQKLSGTSSYYAVMELTPGSYNEANGQMSQTLPVLGGSAYQFSADVYFNSPDGLPAGAVCTITYQVGSTPIYGYETNAVTIDSNNHISDSQTGSISSTDCNASLQIYADCSNITSPLTVGFDNVKFVLQSSSSTTSSPSSTTTSSATASATSTNTNLIVNGDFGTGDYSHWALYRLGNTSFAIQGNPSAYLAVMTFTAGGDYNSQAGLMQQTVTVSSSTTYTMNMGMTLNYPSGLANDGSECDLQVYLVDSNGYGVLFAQQSYTYGDAAYQSVSGSGKINTGFTGYFDVLIRCYGGANPIVAGFEDIQVLPS